MGPLLSFVYQLLGGSGSVPTQTRILEFAGAVDMTMPPYNADPTGAVDVTSAINAAINDGFKVLRFKAGTYKYGAQTFQGPVDYYLAEDTWRWRPSYDVGGYIEALLNITSTAVTLSSQHFGHILQFNSSAQATITINAGIVPKVIGNVGTDKAGGYWFIVKSGPYGVLLSPGTGITMYRAGSAANIAEFYVPGGGSAALVSYLWTGDTTARVDVFPLNIVADRTSVAARAVPEIVVLGDGSTISVDYAMGGLSTSTNQLALAHRIVHGRNSGAGNGAVSLALPTTTSNPAPQAGTTFFVRNRTADSSLVTLTVSGSSTINGASSVSIAPGGAVTVQAVDISGSAITWRAEGDLAGDIVLPASTTVQGNLVVQGHLTGQSVPAMAVSSSMTVAQADANKTIVVTASATITVPDTFRGRVFIRNTHTAAITVSVTGAGNYSLPAGRGLAVECVQSGSTTYRSAAEIIYVSLS